MRLRLAGKSVLQVFLGFAAFKLHTREPPVALLVVFAEDHRAVGL
jgi:hypothetical protein